MAGETMSTTRRAALGAGAVGLAVLLGAGFLGCGRPPQMGADEEVFHAVDALFTATTARDANLLGQCERRLQTLAGAGKLPPAASAYLDSVIGKAREGRWESAAETLYDFMKAQRREGASDHHPAKKEKGRRNPGTK